MWALAGRADVALSGVDQWPKTTIGMQRDKAHKPIHSPFPSRNAHLSPTLSIRSNMQWERGSTMAVGPCPFLVFSVGDSFGQLPRGTIEKPRP